MHELKVVKNSGLQESVASPETMKDIPVKAEVGCPNFSHSK